MTEKEERQLENADARARFYDKHVVPPVFAQWALLLVDAASVAQGQRILDVACGTGIVARVLADQVVGHVEITGIDLNRSMTKIARRLCPDIDWHQGNVTSMPFADESFDVVLCQAALMLFRDQVVALQEMRRVLCSSGRIAVMVPGAIPQPFDIACEILGKVAGKEVANVWRSEFALRDHSDVTSLFVKAGFESANLKTHQVTARYPSIAAFLHAHVGFVTAGRVDADAILALAREKLAPFCTASGAMHIPIEGHVATASMD
jgi:ubiquinone/menaquinone biosynthesis C-methylase UbiE